MERQYERVPAGEFAEPRPAHTDGFIHLCKNKSDDDKKWAFLSSGTDGEVWLWNEDELDVAQYVVKNVGDRTHNAIAWHGSDVFIGHTQTDVRTGIEKAVVSRFSVDDFAVSAPLASFSLDVTCIDISKSASLLAVGAIDHVIKVIRLADGDYNRLECQGQIMCVAIDPTEKWLAASASDGILSVFALPAKNGAFPIFSMRLCSRIPDIDPSQSRLQICWSEDSKFIFAPALGCIKKLSSDPFNLATTYACVDALNEMYSVCCLSKCGKYLAGSTLFGAICVWNVKEGNLLSLSKYLINGNLKVICSMVWHSKLENTLVFVDTEEHICTLSRCTSEIKEVTKEAPTKKKLIFDDDDDDDDENTKLSSDLGAIKKAYGFGDDRFDDDDHVATSRIEHRPFVPVKAFEPVPPYKPPTVPRPFASGSTPEHLSERYLIWNRYGVVTCFTSDEENTIEATWHDASVHSEMTIDNVTSNFVIADITNEALALASKEDGDTPSMLKVHYIAAWDPTSREWSVNLPAGESVEDVAIGGIFIAAVTSFRYIRIFSHAGTQRIVISHPGALLTVSAFNDRLAVVTLDSGYFFEEGNEKPQFNMKANIYHINPASWFKMRSPVESVPVAVGRGAELEWLGYSKGGILCTMDSKCCVRILTSNGLWMPIHNFSQILKSQSDHIWPVGVVEDPEPEIRYVYCKGTKYPLLTNKLVPQIAKWEIPLCSHDSEKSQLEEKLLLAEIRRFAFSQNKTSASSNVALELVTTYAKDVIRLFALTCKTERECRAAELALLEPNPQVIQSLCNFAAKTRHPQLVEKVAEIGRKQAEEKEENGKFSSHEDENDVIMPRRSLNYSALKKRSVVQTTQEEGENSGEVKEEVEDDPMNSSLSSVQSSITPVNKIRLASNPFKRKAANDINISSGNIFEELSSPAVRVSPLTDSVQFKKSKKADTAKQSLLSFGALKEEKEELAGKKTGFELWLESSKEELRKEHAGSEHDFTKFAAKQFRLLPSEIKQKWNSLARSSGL